jgi:hypothetical protein
MGRVARRYPAIDLGARRSGAFFLCFRARSTSCSQTSPSTVGVICQSASSQRSSHQAKPFSSGRKQYLQSGRGMALP